MGTYCQLSSSVVTALLSPGKDTLDPFSMQGANMKTLRFIYLLFFNLLDSSPVFKDVDVSQHVDNERPCETRKAEESTQRSVLEQQVPGYGQINSEDEFICV